MHWCQIMFPILFLSKHLPAFQHSLKAHVHVPFYEIKRFLSMRMKIMTFMKFFECSSWKEKKRKLLTNTGLYTQQLLENALLSKARKYVEQVSELPKTF